MIRNPKPMHPGQVLLEIYMKEMDLNQSQLAEK
jgi:plasmid maintenance system antidote protein VapI